MHAFTTLRGCTRTHQSAHFNMIERGVAGADPVRDAATKDYPELWLQRPRRDYYVNLSDTYPHCDPAVPPCAEDRAAVVIPSMNA